MCGRHAELTWLHEVGLVGAHLLPRQFPLQKTHLLVAEAVGEKAVIHPSEEPFGKTGHLEEKDVPEGERDPVSEDPRSKCSRCICKSIYLHLHIKMAVDFFFTCSSVRQL